MCVGNVTLRLDRHILYLCINLIKFLHGVILYGFFLIRCIPCIISQQGVYTGQMGGGSGVPGLI